MSALLNLAVTFAATSTKPKTTSANPYSLVFIVVIVGAVYFLFLRPQQQRARRQREQTSAVSVGDEVLTVGGIIGRVVEAQADRLVIESGGADSPASYGATPSRMVVLRSAVSRRIEPVSAEVHDDEDDEPDHDPGDEPKADGSSGSQAEEGSGA